MCFALLSLAVAYKLQPALEVDSSATSVEGRTAVAQSEGVEIVYEISSRMRISLNLYDDNGQIVRALLNGVPRASGLQREFWDGRDQAGEPLPPGEYAWKLLAMPGRLKTEHLLTVGTNYPDPEPPNDTRHYRAVAPGTHGGPTAVAADASGIYIGASCTENIENFLVKLSPDGESRLWWAFHRVPWKGAMAMALSGNRLLVLSTNDGEIWPYMTADGQTLPAIPTALSPVNPDNPDPSRIPSGLAANDRELALCYPDRGLVRWCNTTNGTVLAEVSGLDKPSALAIAQNGTTYAVCSTNVLRLDRQGGAHTLVISSVSKPTQIALNTAGEILVYDSTTEQVLRFDASGSQLVAYGQEGGRRDGSYDQTAQESFLGVTALASAPDGGFLVAEPNDAPRRVAWFKADGRLRGEWYGGHVWAPWVAVDPENPSTVFMPSSWNSIMRLEVDLPNKTWQVRAVYHIDNMANGMLPRHTNAELYRAFRRDGNLYLARNQWPWAVYRVDDTDDQLVPVMVAMPQMRHYFSTQPALVREWAAPDDQGYIWTDTSGDGRPQREEVRFFKKGGFWSALPEWNAMGVYAIVGRTIQRWMIADTATSGVLTLSDFPASQPMLELPPHAERITSRWGSYMTADPKNGGWYVAINSDMPTWGQSKDSFLIAYNADGSQRWLAGGKTIGTPQSHLAPGEIGCFRRIAGTTHDCVVVNDFKEGAWPLTSYVWDRDGLWVGGVMDEIDRQVAPVWRYGAGGEALGTTLVNDPTTGDVLLYWHGFNDVRIGKVTGWKGWVRKSGQVNLAAAAPATSPRLTEVEPGTGQGLRLEFWDQSKPVEALALIRLTDLTNEHWGPSGGSDGLRILRGGLVARVTGEIEAYQTGWHAFRADGYPPKTTYRIAGFELGQYSFNEIYLEAGKRYPVEILYDAERTHPSTDQGIRLQWTTPRGTWPGGFSPIPVSQLYALPLP